MKVSIIMPVAPGCSPGRAFKALQGGLPRGMQVELLVISGLQPSRQRNLAARSARGDFLYFLDHDSEVGRETMGLLLKEAGREGVSASGGPNLPKLSTNWMEGIYGRIFSSPLGSPMVSSRYRGDGVVRPAGERDLILCNLMVRREVFLDMGGFDPRLYPNEENEFLNRLADRGGRAIYRPDAPVLKPRKYSIYSFAWESFRNGRGRMEQIWVDIHANDAIFLMIPAGVLAWIWMAITVPQLLWAIPAYFGAILAENLRILAQNPPISGGLVAKPAGLAVSSFLMILRHASYGLGLLWGGLWGWRARTVKISVMTLQLGRYLVERGRMALAGRETAEIGLK